MKVEPPRGDSFRFALSSLGAAAGPDPFLASPAFYGVNRGKKSVALDLEEPLHRGALFKLLSSADVFLTNARQKQLQAWGLDAMSLHKRFPTLVVCALTGFGDAGDDKDAPGYDVGCFFARSGVASEFTSSHPKYGLRQMEAWRKAKRMGIDDRTSVGEALHPPVLPGGFGDIFTGSCAVAGICAALTARAETGKGQIVETSLLATGVWANMWATMTELAFRPVGKIPSGPRSRHARFNPLINSYVDSDGKVFFLLGFQSQRHFPSIARAVGRTDWLENNHPFAKARGRTKKSADFTFELDKIFASKPLSFWKTAFERERVWWQPCNTPAEAIDDAQVKAIGALAEVELSPADQARGTKRIISVRSPLNFSSGPSFAGGPGLGEKGQSQAKLGAVPSVGEHTNEILKSVGVAEEECRKIVEQTRSKL